MRANHWYKSAYRSGAPQPQRQAMWSQRISCSGNLTIQRRRMAGVAAGVAVRPTIPLCLVVTMFSLSHHGRMIGTGKNILGS